MRFYGQYLQRLDDKNRVVVPRRFRDIIGEAELRGGLVLTRGFDKCLFLFPRSLWGQVAGEFSAAHFTSYDARTLQRLFFSKAVDVEPDKTGRILLPDLHRRMAGIEDEALFVGASNRIEVWSPSRWADLEQAHDEQFEELAERFYQALEKRPGS